MRFRSRRCGTVNPETGVKCTRAPHDDDDHHHSDGGGTITDEWGTDFARRVQAMYAARDWYDTVATTDVIVSKQCTTNGHLPDAAVVDGTPIGGPCWCGAWTWTAEQRTENR